jgi:hypothetical protein
MGNKIYKMNLIIIIMKMKKKFKLWDNIKEGLLGVNFMLIIRSINIFYV